MNDRLRQKEIDSHTSFIEDVFKKTSSQLLQDERLVNNSCQGSSFQTVFNN